MLAVGAVAAFALISSIGAQQPRVVDANLLKLAGTPNDPLTGAWITNGRTQNETRYSPLKQINTTNVGSAGSRVVLRGRRGRRQSGRHAADLDNTIYGITTWSVVFAVDARTGKEIWRWDPEVNQTRSGRQICCGVVNRGLAHVQRHDHRADQRRPAAGARRDTGKPVWESRVAYSQDRYTLTMAPRIAKGQSDHRRGGRRSSHARLLRRLRCGHRPASLEVLHRSRRSLEGLRERRDEGRGARPGAANGGSWAAAERSGTASPTIPTRTWSTSAPATPSLGCRNSAARRAWTTCTPARSWRWT